MRQPRWNDIRRFCEVDAWDQVHKARGAKRGDHDRFRKMLPDGRILRTKASHGAAEIGDPGLVNEIIRRQLQVTHDEFWDAVDNGNPPVRSQPKPPEPEDEAAAHRLEDWLAVHLTVVVGLTTEEVASLTPDEAMERYLQWCREQQPG